MKKVIALTLILALLLCGCGGSQEPVSGEITPQPSEETQLPEKELSIGRIEGGVYTNNYLGIGCELDADWSFYTAEELQEMPGDIQDQMDGSEMGEAMENYQQIFDVAADNVNDLQTLNIVYTKLSMQERLLYATMSEEEIIDSVMEQSDMMIESYVQSGMEVESMEKIKVNFLGEEHYGVLTMASNQGIPIYMVQLWFYNLGAYGGTMTVGSYMENTTQDVLDMFYAVE